MRVSRGRGHRPDMDCHQVVGVATRAAAPVQQAQEAQAVLSAGHRDRNPLARADHLVRVDRAVYLFE